MTMTVTMAELVETAKQARAAGATTEIVGGWVWARFGNRPDETTIAALKKSGFRWSKAKRRWYFVGAISTARRRHSWQEITSRYAPLTIEEAAAIG